MKNLHTRRLYLWGLGILPVLAGCATSPLSSTALKPPKLGDEGVIIAESHMVRGPTTAMSVTGQPDDCAGPGLGIAVQGTVSGSKYLYDDNGEPCEPAQLLFDGRSRKGQRAADPGITLTFHDSLGLQNPVPLGRGAQKEELERLPAVPGIRVASEFLEGNGVEPASGNNLGTIYAGRVGAVAQSAGQARKPDPLLATLTTWQAEDTTLSKRAQEANAAAARNLENIAKDTQIGPAGEENLGRLGAELRERERQIEEEQRRHAETLERAQEKRAQTVAAQVQWQQRETELSNELSANRQRLRQLEELTANLQNEKRQKERAYQEKISTLSADLQAAQTQADAARRNLVLQAAAKIAEAEQLAHAAQMQEQDIKLREAARLKTEAETLMDRALAIKAGEQVVVDGIPGYRQLPLADVPVAIAARNQTLEELLNTVLKQAQPRAGEWKADWQLSPKAQQVLKEKWSLTAEAPVQQVLAQITQQVQAKHGLVLGFTQFNQSRLLVVTDVPAKAPAAQ